MVDYSSSFVSRMKRVGASPYERRTKRLGREFDRYYADALNKEPVTVDGRDEMLIFQDHSQSNNKDLSDDKYVIAPNAVTVGIGSYIGWRDEQWLVFTEEVKTIPSHQQLKVKHVNQQMFWLIDGKVSNNGKGWGAYVQNQTLYTLGVSNLGNYLDVANAKMMLYVQNNEETQKIAIGQRFFIGHDVYRCMFKDDVSRIGLINLLMEEDTFNPETDDREKRIAGIKLNDGTPAQVETPVAGTIQIEGDLHPRLGMTYVYKTTQAIGDDVSDYDIDEWTVSCVDGTSFVIQEKDTHSITLRIKDDYRCVGQIINLIAKKGDQIYSQTLNIRTKY